MYHPSLAAAQTLDIVMDCVSPRNIDEVVLVLKKEILKTQEENGRTDGNDEYRQMVIHAIHSCAVKVTVFVCNGPISIYRQMVIHAIHSCAVKVTAFSSRSS